MVLKTFQKSANDMNAWQGILLWKAGKDGASYIGWYRGWQTIALMVFLFVLYEAKNDFIFKCKLK